MNFPRKSKSANWVSKHGSIFPLELSLEMPDGPLTVPHFGRDSNQIDANLLCHPSQAPIGDHRY
jgi:hypothetical protein